MRLKQAICGFIAALFGICLVSCDPGDQEIKKLNRNDGTWTIESVHYEYYDSVGVNVTADSTQQDVGEFVFFTSKTMDALYAGYLVVANLTQPNGTIAAFPGNIYYDGKRVFMQEDPDANHSFPDQFEGVWTVETDKRNRQEWVKYVMSPSNYLWLKETILLKKK